MVTATRSTFRKMVGIWAQVLPTLAPPTEAHLIQILIDDVIRLCVCAEAQNAGNVFILDLHLVGKVHESQVGLELVVTVLTPDQHLHYHLQNGTRPHHDFFICMTGTEPSSRGDIPDSFPHER